MTHLTERYQSSGAWSPDDHSLVMSILEQANITVWAGAGSEDNFAIRLWGPGAERIYGHPREKALGRSYLDLFVHPRERARAVEDHERIIETGEIYNWDWAADDLTADGEVRTMLTHCFRVRDPNDGSWLLAELGIDISDLTRPSQQLRKVRDDEYLRQELTLARAIGRIGQAVAEVTSEGDLTNIGDEVLAAVRASVSGIDRVLIRIEGDTVPLVVESSRANVKEFPFDEDEAFKLALDEGHPIFFDQSDPRSPTFRLASPERRGRQRSFAILPMFNTNTGPFGVLALALSTGKKFDQAERDRLTTIVAFAGPLISVAQQLIANREAESRRLLEEQRQVVWDDVMHTVGNEVFVLLGLTSSLKGVIERGGLPAGAEDILLQIGEQAEQVNTSLERERRELAEPLRQESVSLEQAVYSIVLPLQRRYPGIDFDVEVDPRHTTWIVGHSINHIIRNLILNAIQAMNDSDLGGRLSVTSRTRDDGVVELHFGDSGPGVDPSIREAIFKRGVSHRRPRGTGSGLGNARSLARGAGGDVHLAAEPSPLGGALFIVELPRGEAGWI